LQESNDADLFIIMGTSLSVSPFARIPYLANRNADVVLFNKSLVGEYEYNKLYCNALFIEGKQMKVLSNFWKIVIWLMNLKTF